MIHIVIAGGSATMRGALAQIIGASSDILVDEEATLNTEAFERIRSRRVDLMLLDTTTSDLSGIRLIQQVHAEQPELPILVLSALNGAANVSRLLRAGASGYITSENRPDDLRVAVRQVASGERFIDPLLVDAIFFGTPADNGSQEGPLSNRENQVL